MFIIKTFDVAEEDDRETESKPTTFLVDQDFSKKLRGFN